MNAPVEPNVLLGDVNLNSFAFEIADMVLFINFFIYGKAIFTVDSTAQIAASDINDDGTPLTVVDLVNLIRVVTGDDEPIPKEDSLAVLFSHDIRGILSVIGDVKIGSAFVVVSGITTPYLLAENMEMNWNYDGINTRILVYSRYGHCFTGNFLVVSDQIVSMEMATFEGQPVCLSKFELPILYMFQNYPNPFDSSTTIWFSLDRPAEADCIIVNSVGQVVFKLSKYCRGGNTLIIWDGTDYTGQQLPNGNYYCSVTANNEKKTIEMFLQR